VIQPVRPARYELKELVSLIREDNIHGEIPTGKRVGREVW
jgi:antitoxin component of MazEF toxin-antitoxin module